MFICKNNSKNSFLQALFSIKCESEQNKSRYKLQIVNALIALKSKYNIVYPSQEEISRWVGVCRDTVNREMKELESLGILKKIYRHRKTCIYILNPLFDELAELSYFRKLLPALKQVYFNSIYRVFKTIQTPYKEEEDYFNNPSITMLEKKVQKLSGFVRESIRGVKNKFLSRNEEKIPTKGGVEMIEPSKVIISEVLQRITKVLCLTQAGQFKLMVFPERALVATLQEYNRRHSLKDPFFWFLMYAKGYCIQNNLHVDWDLWHILCKKYQVADDAPYVQKPKLEKPAAHSIKKVEIEEKSEEYYEQQRLEVSLAKSQGRLAKGWEFDYPGSLKN